jgi:hypothetical protein
LRSVVVELADFDVLITAARRRERETVVDEREVDLLTHNVMHQVLQQSQNHTYSCPDATVPQISVPQNRKKPISFLQAAENKSMSS